jgi:hypothetical protein
MLFLLLGFLPAFGQAPARGLARDFIVANAFTLPSHQFFIAVFPLLSFSVLFRPLPPRSSWGPFPLPSTSPIFS